MLYKFVKVFLLVLIVFITSCDSKKENEPEEKILVKIGDVTISLSEFIRRSEYTVRPPYCKGSHNLDKKIVINSLIAEKLLALEATDTNMILQSENVKLYLQGIKEQGMRQWLYAKEADEKVELDSAAILKTMQVAGRKYKVSYFSLPDSSMAVEVDKKLNIDKKTFEDTFYELTGIDSIPYREVEWSTNEHNSILDSLYSEPLKKNQIVGPIKINKNEYLFARINGWLDTPIIIEKQFNERWKDVSEKYHSRKAQEIYTEFIIDVMKDKNIEFMPETFFKMANLLGPIYLTTDKEKEDALNNAVWQIENNEVDYSPLNDQLKEMQDQPFFKINDEIYSIKDFIKEVKIHPLVFRQKKIKKKDFGQQLQFAIMDLIRDKYLTEVAYEREYDQINVVKRNYNMWKDNFSYIYYKEKYLRSVLPDSADGMNYITVLENYLNKYVDSLQYKYSDKIQIDVEEFNKIELTRIDMNVNYNNEAYSRVVPSFPIITTDNKLDYGKKMYE
ncbi:MAG: hypothetical protein H6610_01615 [Ignavibacteriales bacterium]|nr:hypothetical protein [Ignavibacteriales bacterium]MCB9218139.1 hypothetical protein [Ignavibacteriales bacterium]MCB9260528.1 hypothetical protein [Ignavibacteriales bacterium]